MKVEQYVYLGVRSEVSTPDEITRDLGLVPDHHELRGSNRVGPTPVPWAHLWHLHSGLDRKATLCDHFKALIARIRPAEDALRRLVESGRHHASIEVVRYFEPGPELDAILAAHDTAPAHPDLEKLRGQHPLLGFVLEAEDLALLGRLGLAIDFDEYGDEYE